jgi:hypothetical protein
MFSCYLIVVLRLGEGEGEGDGQEISVTLTVTHSHPHPPSPSPSSSPSHPHPSSKCPSLDAESKYHILKSFLSLSFPQNSFFSPFITENPWFFRNPISEGFGKNCLQTKERAPRESLINRRTASYVQPFSR